MKRPLAFLCLAAVIWMTVSAAAGKRIEESPPFLAREALLEALKGERRIIIRGDVAKSEAVSTGIRLFVNQLSIQKKDKSVISLLPQYKINFILQEKEILPGDSILVEGEFAPHEPASNPGEFDAQAYYLSSDVIGSLWEPDLVRYTKGEFSVCRLLEQIRRRFVDSYKNILGDKAAALMAAVSLGEKGLMETEWKLLYQEGGIAHIFAVSGLHISLVGMGLFRLLRLLRTGYGLSALICAAAVFSYGMMTGFSISAMRAVLMFFVWAGAQVCGRKNDLATALSLSAAVIVFLDARNTEQSSFWLSFAAVGSIAVVMPAMQKMCSVRNTFWKSFVSGVSVWIGTLPCVLYFFYQTTPWSILINLAVIPLMPLIMVSGFCAGTVGMLNVEAGVFLAAPVHYLFAVFEWLCRMQQKLPHALWAAGRPSAARIALYYAVLAAILCLVVKRSVSDTTLLNKAQRISAQVRRGRLIFVLLCGFCTAVMGIRSHTDLRVTCFSVGQGDCALVRMPGGGNCLIDGGSTSRKNIWEYVISRGVKYYGIRTLDYVFLSHADEDHISGIKEFLESYECGAGGRNIHGITMKYLVLPPTADAKDFLELKKLAYEKGVEVLGMERGSAVTDGKAALTCLAPDGDHLTGERNEDSMVLMLSYGKFRMLFTGDLENEAEKRLAQSEIDLSADVLKVGHHGSAGASSEVFLDRVNPKISVISCGKNNRYGHPAKETLKRLYRNKSAVFQTPECGAVTICSDGESFTGHTFVQTIVLKNDFVYNRY